MVRAARFTFRPLFIYSSSADNIAATQPGYFRLANKRLAMNKKLTRVLLLAGLCFGSELRSEAQISLIQDYKNNKSATIGTFQGISFREAGFSGLYPIPGTNGKEFWVCSDRGVNVDAANANPSTCRPTYDKIYGFPNYAPKIHRIRLNGDSVQILRTITMKRPGGAAATGVLNPTGFGSTAAEQASTDTVLDCANFAGKIAAKDVWGIDAEGIVVDKDGNFWVCEEGGPTIWKMNPNGVVIARYTPYANLAGAQAQDRPIDTVFKYRKNNRGFENIAITPSGKIYVAIQSPLLFPTQSVGEGTRIHRIMELDPATGNTRMFAYLNDGIIGSSGSNQIRLRDWKLGDMAAINDTTFLIIEAAIRGTSDYRRVYKISLNGATPVTSGLYGGNTLEALVDSTGLAGQSITPVRKSLFMNLLANGWPVALDKAEGIAILNDSTVFLCNDNDYGQSSPSENGIATATTNLSHVFKYGLKGSNKLVNYVPPVSVLNNTGVTGQTSSQAPYLLPTTANGLFTAIMTTGDNAAGYVMCGTPDGLGAFDNNNGTFTVLMNHEFGNTAGVTRAHGGTGAFVSKWIIDKSDLSVVSGSDLIQRLKAWNPLTSSYITYSAAFPSATGLHNMGRFCSGDLPSEFAFYNPLTGKGTQERIYMNGEETGVEGRGLAHVVTGAEAGTTYELPYLGKFSWENNVASPRISDTTVVAGMDDATPGQVYFYVGVKQASGNEIEKAGLSGGNLWSVSVSGMLSESSSSLPAANTAFSMVNLGQVHNTTGAALEANSNNAGVTRFLRPEDGAWDPQNPSDFYFATTNAFNAPSRLWKLHFTNPGNITLGGTITAVLDGTEGQQMLDNIAIDNSGHVLLVEDVGGNAHIGKVWQYNIAKDSLYMVGMHDTTRFLNGSANFLTQDEEATGQIDAQSILGPGMYLISDQAHYSQPGQLVEGGQLMAFYNPVSAVSNPEVELRGNNVSIADGDITPVMSDSTDFGILNTGTSQVRNYVIANNGVAPLTINGVYISGPQSAPFTILNPPALPLTIAPAGTYTLQVRFAPTSDSTRIATLSFVTNDLDESYYDVRIQGRGGVPEINVQGNGSSISDGDITPGTANFTDFGSVIVGNNNSHSFTIQNNGTGTLTLSRIAFTGTNASEFTLTGAPTLPLVIAPGGNQTINVQFTPGATGLRTATLEVNSDDADEALYDFALQGRGMDPLGVGSVQSSKVMGLYPNPTGGDATLELNLKVSDRIIVTILNTEGKAVAAPIDNRYDGGKQLIKLPTATLPSGVYFIQVATGAETVRHKLVVSH